MSFVYTGSYFHLAPILLLADSSFTAVNSHQLTLNLANYIHDLLKKNKYVFRTFIVHLISLIALSVLFGSREDDTITVSVRCVRRTLVRAHWQKLTSANG